MLGNVTVLIENSRFKDVYVLYLNYCATERAIANTMEDFTKLASNWGLPGLVLSLAVHSFITTGNTSEAIGLALLALFIFLAVRFFQRLNPSVNKLFDWIIKNLENGVLQMWWLVTANFKGKYYKQLIFQCRDYRTQGLKTKGPFALDLEKVFVPLKVGPESLGQISSNMLQQKAAKNTLRIWDFLTKDKNLPAYRGLAVLGPPGSGKSTLLEHLVLTYARNRQRQSHPKARRFVPILIYLRDIRETVSQPDAPDLPALVEQQAEIKKLNPNGWFATQLKRGNCLVMLDGLDEVADVQQRRQVSQWVSAQIRAFPQSYFLVTSRPFGYRNMPLDEIRATLEVKPFTLPQIKAFIQNWYLQNELSRHLGKEDEGVRQEARRQSAELINRIINQPSLSKLALNPLLLTMIATVHYYRGALPGRRVELYDEICDVLLGRRQDAKGISDSLTAIQKKTVLQSLALGLMRKKTREFSLPVGASLIQKTLQSISSQIEATSFLKSVENQSGLLIEREKDVYEFTHKSFQEYLAAIEVTPQQVELLVDKMDDEWWAETIRLYSAQSDATPFIQAALRSDNIKILSLAFDCLEEKLSVQPSIQAQFEEKLLHGLEMPGTDIFRLAAETKLARRLNKLLRIDEKTAIDTSYISCSEYQLFIDEQRQQDSNHQPDQWSGYRFPAGTANQPISGIRASDAASFCQWLSRRTGQNYRMPQHREAQTYQIHGFNIGTWSSEPNLLKLSLSGISEKRLQHWQVNICSSLEKSLNRDLSRALALARVLDLALARVLARARALDRDRALDLARALDRALDRNFDFALALDLDRARARALDLDRALDHNRARDLDLDLDRVRARDLDRARTRDLEGICSYLSLHIVFWEILIDIYEKARGNARKYQTDKEDCLRSYEKVLDMYIFFLIVRLRQAGELPAWESLQLVREET